MQRVYVNVRLGGDLTNTVDKYGVSPAEILILRHIHGDDAVQVLRSMGNDRGKQNVDEREKLTKFYGAGKVREVFGVTPKFPETLADIGIDLFADEEPLVIAPRRGRPPKEKDEATVEAVTADDLK